VLGQPLELGLDAKGQALLALTLLLGVITWHRPDYGASGYRTFGHLRRFLVLCGGAVSMAGHAFRG
jgi:hypothetical protein